MSQPAVQRFTAPSESKSCHETPHDIRMLFRFLQRSLCMMGRWEEEGRKGVKPLSRHQTSHSFLPIPSEPIGTNAHSR